MAAHTYEGLEQLGYKQELVRSLRTRHLVIYGLTIMVVIAPFGVFGSVYQASAGMVALAYLIGMAAMMLTASSYSVMARAYPAAGSVFTYAGRAIAAPVGFMTGWAILLDYVLVPALLGLIAATSMSVLFLSIPVWAWIVALIAVNTVLNLRGIKATKKIMVFFVAGQLVVLVIYLVVAVDASLNGKGQGFSWAPFLQAHSFTLSVAAGAVSVAVLSFLGFDAISMLAEENQGEAKQIGRAMYVALGLTGVLFIAQTFVAALLVPNPAQLIADGDPNGTAFYDTARVAGGPWLATLTAVATALAWGIGNNMVAQLATSRLLYAMARDRQLPAFLARMSPRRKVPANAVWLTAVVSLVLGLYMASRADGIAVLVSLVNFGAMCSFIVLHVSVVWRWFRTGCAGNWVRNLIIPVSGAGVLVFVVVNANILAQRVGLAWIAVGLFVLALLYATGRRPHLAGLDTTPAGGDPAGTPAWAGRRG